MQCLIKQSESTATQKILVVIDVFVVNKTFLIYFKKPITDSTRLIY